MSEPEKISITTSARQFPHASLSPPQSHALPSSTDFRIMELEIENSRLQRLVAELLLKNQRLRKEEE